MATYPQSIADYIAGLTDDDFINGGHRTNFIPTAQGTWKLAYYVQDQSIGFTEYVDAKAAQVAADAASAAAGSGTEASIANIRAIADVAHYISMRRIAAANVIVSLTDAETIAWDMAGGINFGVTIGSAGRALANPINQVAGKSGFLNVTQDGTGGRTITGWGNNFTWFGDTPDWPTAPGSVTKIAYFVRSNGKVELAFAGNATS